MHSLFSRKEILFLILENDYLEVKMIWFLLPSLRRDCLWRIFAVRQVEIKTKLKSKQKIKNPPPLSPSKGGDSKKSNYFYSMLVIVDYKMGNHHSVKKKLDGLKVESLISSDPEIILNATKLILPGVGHFGKAMENLRELNLIDALNEAVLVKKTPILGICLGMQLMAKSSEEGTENRELRAESRDLFSVKGLGWFDADVVKFKVNDTLRFKVPHTGWNTISIEKESPLMKNISPDSEFYFVHSYYMKANDASDVLNYTDYGTPFASAISKGNIYGFQYHPEKSHDVGLQLIRNFVGGFENLSHPIENLSHPIENLSHTTLTEASEVNTPHQPLTEELEVNTMRPRIIPVLLLQKLSLVKTQNFKHPKYIGDPINAVKIFNDLRADELVFLDIEASKEKRLISLDFVKNVGEEANMPFAVGGGIRSLEDIRSIIAAGAEKVVINSYAVENPAFVAEAAAAFGSSTIAICIDVKKKLFGGLQTWALSGTKASGFSPLEFAILMQEKGAGEIIIQSIEKDGTMAGYDIELIKQISEAVTIPVIALGGAGNMEHLKEGHEKGFANGLAAGSFFVYQGTKRGVLISYPEKEEMKFVNNG
jgi:cyclase